MSEPNTSETTTNNTSEKPASDRRRRFNIALKRFWRGILDYTHLRDDTDYESTIDYISSSVEFRGVNVWILIFAIIVASVGLNVNSTPVIIGAMLISPLMGPITGIGLSVGTVDEDLLNKSIRNFLIMVLISIITSTIYFLISPLSEAQSELLARTRPTLYDVFIAFFGGLAGIVATSRKSQQITVISGVAIATALMPPLCTAGYGLATLQPKFFFGAFYLFFINSFFIAVATFAMVRYLGFPLKKYLDTKRQTAVKRMIYLFAILVSIPSVFMAMNLVRESAFNAQAVKFVNEIQQNKIFGDAQLIESQNVYGRKSQTITMRVIGHPFSNENIQKMQDILHEDYGLSKTKLIVRQVDGTIDITQQNQLIEDIIDKKDDIIREQDSLIIVLEDRLNTIGNSEVMKQVIQEIYTQYPDIKKVALSEMDIYSADTDSVEKVPVVYVKWKDSSSHDNAEKRLTEWLKVRLKSNKVEIVKMKN